MIGKTVIVNLSKELPEAKCIVLDKVRCPSVVSGSLDKYVVYCEQGKVYVIYPDSIIKIEL